MPVKPRFPNNELEDLGRKCLPLLKLLPVLCVEVETCQPETRNLTAGLHGT